MDSFYAFCYATAGWLATQAVPLIVSPRIIVTLLSNDVHVPTAMEAYLARSLGFTLVPFAVMFLFLTGAIPLGSNATSIDISDVRASPYTTPTLFLTTLYHAFVGFYTYSRYVNKATSQFCYLLATIVSGMLAAMGLWVLMFGGESHISRRTGADKRTGNWPFGNKEAAKSRVPKSVTRAQQKMQQQQGMRGEDIELKEL